MATFSRQWRLILPLLAMTAWASRAIADTYPRQPGVDAQHYVFRLTLNDENDEFVGETTAEILFVKGDVGEFSLNLMSITNGRGMTVSEVTSGGKPVKFTHADSLLKITLDPPPKAGEKQEFTIKYKGLPGPAMHIGNNRYGERCFFSENWPDRARGWLPCIDHPSDKATSEFLITAPSKYQVVANGLLIEEVDQGNGTRMTHWKQSVPIATWLNAIGVAQFSVHHAGMVRGIELQTWVDHQDAAALNGPIEDAARKAIEFYSDYVGPYAYEKLANVQAYGIGGGTEHASAIFYGERSLNPNGVSGLVAHEVAHQWFGNCVTESDWDDVWLSEGFATYFALLYTEKYQGHAAFIAGVKRSRDGVMRSPQNQTNTVIHNNISNMRGVLNNTIQYQKGAQVLHMLRGVMGDEKFQAGLQAYFKKFHDANASTNDLCATMEEVSGMKLKWFFDQWLRRPGAAAIEGTWHYDATAKKVVIELAQTQTMDPFRLPMEVGVTTEAGGKAAIQKIDMTDRKQTFDIPADKEPASVELDPNSWILMSAEFAKQ